MDALRKAEQQKQQIAAQESPQGGVVSDNLELEPLSAKAGRGQLPELPKRLADLDEQFYANAARPSKPMRAGAGAQPQEPGGRSSPPGADFTSRATARNVFAAKQPAIEVRYGFALAVGLSTLVAATAIGAYAYWQMQPKGGLSVGPALVQPTRATAPAVPSGMAQIPASSPSRSPSAVAAAPAEPASAPWGRPPTESLSGNPSAHPGRQTSTPSRPVAPEDLSIRVSAAARKLDPALEKAHRAFNRGELEVARAAWQNALQSDPRNAYALHGLAATAQLGGQADQAVDYYRRALEANPKDALALAGLASLGVAADTWQTGSQIKALLAEQPDSPYLNFALGNFHAQGARWAEAQQAYFKAHAADPANPDYLFNLAVSLDQLHQPRLAARYYERALDAARHQVAGFDPAQAAARLKTLESGLPH